MNNNDDAETKIFLADFNNYRLAEPIDQDKLLNYTSWLMSTATCVNLNSPSKEHANSVSLEIKEKIKRFGVSSELINKRQFVVVPETIFDSSSKKEDKMPLLHKELLDNPNGDYLNVRMNLFKDKTYEVFKHFYINEKSAPDDLIHVTCAGYLSPSPAQNYISNRKWYETQVTHSYHMGCYGAFPAVKMACGFIASAKHSLNWPKNKVDIVHTELVSVHLNVNDTDPGNIVNMTLFGDGFIKYSAYPESEFSKRNVSGLKIIVNHEEILADSLNEMTWVPGPYQFDMFLSKEVPLIVGSNIRNFAKKMCAKAGLDFDNIKEDLVYAIHPGGPKILNYIKAILAIKDDHIKYSKKVLLENGNMSSATVPHIWQEIINCESVKKGQKIISMAFGPGLTATGFIMEKA